MSRDNLTIARPYSAGTLIAAGEAASDTVNSLCIPPGMYDVEISASAIGGGANPTGITATIKENGYLLGDPTHNTAGGWQALVDPRARTANFVAAPAPVNGKVRVYIRGVRITRWRDGLKNAGVDVIPVGGTTPTVGKCQVTFWPMGRSVGWNGLP